MPKITTDYKHQTCQQGCSVVGTAFSHLFAPVTLLEDLDFHFNFYVLRLEQHK